MMVKLSEVPVPSKQAPSRTGRGTNMMTMPLLEFANTAVK
jgi:hypothetical protein